MSPSRGTRPVAASGRAAKGSWRRRAGGSSPYVPTHRGVDVSAVLAQVDRAAEQVAAGSLELEPVEL